MKNLISKTVIMLALTSPAMTVLAVTTDLNTNNETINNNSGLKSPGVDENSSSTLNYVNTETLADTLTTAAGRKGWDGSVKGNSKGINEAGIKRTENHRKGWDGTVKGGNFNEERINGTEDPTDSMLQKANINTSRSNIKSAMKIPTDSLQQTDAGSMTNPYYKPNDNAGEMPAQLQRGIDKKDIRRAVRKDADVNETTAVDNLTQKETLKDSDSNQTNPLQRKTKHDTAKNSVGNIR